MKNFKKSFKEIVWYGFIIWAFPFAIAMTIYPMRVMNQPLFQSFMSVVLVMTTVIITDFFLGSTKHDSFSNGFRVGLLWLLESVFLNIFVFLFGPIRMTLLEYISEIVSSYFMIPIIVAGFSFYPFIKRKGVR